MYIKFKNIETIDIGVKTDKLLKQKKKISLLPSTTHWTCEEEGRI